MGNMLNLTLEIAKTTLSNCGTAIQTATHNISNADNKAYARQKVQLTTNMPYQISAGWLGTGCKVSSIVQQRDQFIEKRLVDSISKESGYKTMQSQFTSAAALVFDDGDYGISQALGEFWDAWETLNQNPTGAAQKTLAYQKTQDLADSIQSAYENLSDFASEIQNEMSAKAAEANSLLKRIAQSNLEIKKMELGGDTANDLRDSRYQDLLGLAEIIPISWEIDETGSLTISVETTEGNLDLVNGNQAYDLGVAANDDNVLQIGIYNQGDNPDTEQPVGVLNTSGDLAGGELPALLKTHDQFGATTNGFDYTNPDDALGSDLTYLDRLNVFAYTLIMQVNSAYPGQGIFTGSDDPADIAINENFTVDSMDLSAPDSAHPDINAAAAIADLQNSTFDTLGGTSLSGYLAAAQEQLGLDLENAGQKAEFQQSLRTQLEEQQQSVSGVSMDEETVELIKYQQIYQAAAKIVQQTAEMMQSVIDMV